jgi:hypothetical protein
MGLLYDMLERGVQRKWEKMRDSLRSFVRYVEFFLKSDVKNGKKCIYLICDFNGRWLKDLSFLCCIVIVLSVEGRVGYITWVRCFLKLVSLLFSISLGQKVMGWAWLVFAAPSYWLSQEGNSQSLVVGIRGA